MNLDIESEVRRLKKYIDENFPEDYPGMHKLILHEKVVQDLIGLIDRAIIELGDGTSDETDYLTGLVAIDMANKVMAALRGKQLAKELRDTTKTTRSK